MTDAEPSLTRLEKLRRQPRSDLKEGLVQAVMVQPSSLEDKIRRIEMIDLLPEDPPPSQGPSKVLPHHGALVRPPRPRTVTPAKPLPPPPLVVTPSGTVPVVDPELDEHRRVEHYRRALERPPQIGGFWAYLLTEYRSIRQFAFESAALVRGSFPFTFRLSPPYQALLGSILWTQTLPVLERFFPLVLKKGWLVVSKLEYNYLAAAEGLCREIRELGPHDGPRPRPAAAWDRVLPCLRLFQTAPELGEATARAWEDAAGKIGVAAPSAQEGADSLRTLLVGGGSRTNLPDALRGLGMMRTRRALSWNEGLHRESGEYFLRDDFDASPEVQREIERATDLLARQLDALAHEAHEISRIRYYLPAQTLLDDFVTEADQADSTAWALLFLTRVGESFTDLFDGTVRFANGEQTRLFSNPSLAASLERLAALKEQMLDPVEGHNPEWTSAAARVIMNFGKTLVVLIRNRSLMAEPLASASDPSQVTDPLPHEDRTLDHPAEWAGLTVIQALVRAARICLLAGRHLGDTSLETSLEKEESLPLRAKPILERYLQMAPRLLGEAKKAQMAWLLRPELDAPPEPS